jgi:preprotein translocase subunit SecF
MILSRLQNIDFTRRWKTWFSISGVLVAIGITALLFTAINVNSGTNLPGLNLGIDYTGGSLLTLDFAEEVTEGDIRSVLISNNLGTSTIQLASARVGTLEKTTVIIRTPPIDEAQKNVLTAALQSEIGSFETISDDTVHAAISRELRDKALMSLLIASIGMVLYITYRFELKFALAAIAAILHDSLAVIGFFALIRFPISGVFVAALLTIIGYSINDTIVVFDRIREKLKDRIREDLADTVNKGIAETLPRSINTSLTTLFAITAVLLFGGQTLREFSLAMVCGIIVGTYSSVFVASPLWYLWKERENCAFCNAAGRVDHGN